MVKKTLNVSLVPIYNAACMPLLFAKNTGLEHRQISLAPGKFASPLNRFFTTNIL
jgi:hypothetical protein